MRLVRFIFDMALLGALMTCCGIALALDFAARLAILPIRLVMGNDAVNKLTGR